jgi:type VII secretion protein EccE
MNTTTKSATVAGVFACGFIGWAIGGSVGGATCLVLGVVLGVVPLRRRPLWSWLILRLWRPRAPAWTQPTSVTNNRAGGGVRYQHGVAVAAVQLLGKAHTPTVFTGSASAYTDNTVDVAGLAPLLRPTPGLAIDSLSVVSAGSRRRAAGDYPRVYDTLIGAPPYAGQRETWLIVRVAALPNAGALATRASVGTATLAAAQRIGAALRQRGIRARVATAADIIELERRLGRSATATPDQRWSSVRGDIGWLTTYWYRPGDITTEKLAQAWTMHADKIIQNVTLLSDGTATATATVATPTRPTAPPSLMLQTLPGEQPTALTANWCGAMPRLGGARRGAPREALVMPIGPSGVLLGKVVGGNRLALPLNDAQESSRVHIAAHDALTKRIIVRLAAAGQCVTVHTRNSQRWNNVRMPGITVDERVRPEVGTAVSVVDGTLRPPPQPNTLISVGEPGQPYRGSADVVITQTGPATVEVRAGGQVHTVEVELFRAENRYAACGRR